MEFYVSVTEMYQKIIIVSADNEKNALEIASQMHEDDEIGMEDINYLDTEFDIY